MGFGEEFLGNKPKYKRDFFGDSPSVKGRHGSVKTPKYSGWQGAIDRLHDQAVKSRRR